MGKKERRIVTYHSGKNVKTCILIVVMMTVFSFSHSFLRGAGMCLAAETQATETISQEAEKTTLSAEVISSEDGETVYALRVTNTGNADAEGIVIHSDPIFFVYNGTYSDSYIEINENLAPGGEIRIGMLPVSYENTEPEEANFAMEISGQNIDSQTFFISVSILEEMRGTDNTNTEPDQQTEEITEFVTEAESEIIEDGVETPEENPDDVLSVTLPTTFNIPMYEDEYGLEVVGDDVVVTNNSSFPVVVNVTSVDVSIMQSLDDGVYSATLGTDTDLLYDFDEIASHSNLEMNLIRNGEQIETYSLNEGLNENPTSFVLQSGDSPDNSTVMNLRGRILDGIYYPGMCCDIRVRMTFDYAKQVTEPTEADEI